MISPRLRDFWAAFWVDWKSGKWEPETHDQLRRYLHPNSLFLDIGAWIGPTTLWALELGAYVIAVEPDPIARAELIKRTEGKQVEIWAGAVGPANGWINIESEMLGDSMTHVINGKSSKSLRVKCWTVEHILGGRKPDLVKMDIEGFEEHLLPSVGPWLASQDIPIVVSMHNLKPQRSWFKGYQNVTGITNTPTWGVVEASNG